jgi:hypothetical protein
MFVCGVALKSRNQRGLSTTPTPRNRQGIRCLQPFSTAKGLQESSRTGRNIDKAFTLLRKRPSLHPKAYIGSCLQACLLMKVDD